MSVNINLLPQAGSLNTTIAKMGRRLTRMAVVCFIFFLVFGSLGVGYLFITSGDLTKINDQNNTYKSNIKSLQEAEQNLVLVRDRVAKVKTILNDVSFEEKLDKVQRMLDTLPSKSQPDAFLKGLISGDDWDFINLDTLELSGAGNYKIELELV